MSTNLYQEEIIDRARNPRFAGEVSLKTHEAEGANTTCGDEITWTLQVDDGMIMEIRHTSRACAICIASADIFAEHITSMNFEDAKKLNRNDHLERLGIPLSPIRLKCALLPIETLRLIN